MASLLYVTCFSDRLLYSLSLPCFTTIPTPSLVLFLLLFCLLEILFSTYHLRKLPWLSRQSDRLLTDRSLVRSQAEAPFLLFLLYSPSDKDIPVLFLKKYASRGSRTHDRAVKSRALYRLS